MLDCGTIAASFKNQRVSVTWSPYSYAWAAVAAALQFRIDERQANKALIHKIEKLKDLRELDPQVLSEIHQQYYPQLFRYAQYRLSDPTIAEDIASEVFLRLIDAVQGNKGPNSSVRGWLFGTAANLVNDYFRQSYREEQILEETGLDPSLNRGAEPFKHLEQQDYLSKALSNLTEEQLHVIALRFGSEMSIEETSKLIGKNQNAVKALQYRAIRSLRRELEVDE